MKTFRVVPQISCCDTFREFADHFQVGDGDILVTNRRRYEKYVKPAGVAIPVLFREDYGKGEPTDEMIDAMGRDMEQYDAEALADVVYRRCGSKENTGTDHYSDYVRYGI